MSGSLQKISTTSIQSAFLNHASNATKKEPQKRPAPLSLRLTSEQRAELEQLAGGRPLGGYIKNRLFDGSAKPNSFRAYGGTVEDRKLLAQVLRALGSSNIIKTLGKLRAADDNRVLIMSEAANFAVHQACRDIAIMRRDLVVALGLKAGGGL